MAEIIRRDTPAAIVDAKMAKELARHVSHMELLAQVAQEAMDELSELHSYSVYRTSATLTTAQRLTSAAEVEQGSAEAEALNTMRQRYLQHMNQLADAAGASIVSSAQAVPAPSQKKTAWETITDSISDAFGGE